MSEQKFKVGQMVEATRVRRGKVTEVGACGLYVNGWFHPFDLKDPSVTHTFTILSEPKPDEPKLIGALVRDAEDYLWSLDEPDGDDEMPWRRVGGGLWSRWSKIDAVEILFPGVEEES